MYQWVPLQTAITRTCIDRDEKSLNGKVIKIRFKFKIIKFIFVSDLTIRYKCDNYLIRYGHYINIDKLSFETINLITDACKLIICEVTLSRQMNEIILQFFWICFYWLLFCINTIVDIIQVMLPCLLLMVFAFKITEEVELIVSGHRYNSFGNCNYTDNAYAQVHVAEPSLVACALYCARSQGCNAFIGDGIECRMLGRCPQCCTQSVVERGAETLYCLTGKWYFDVF